MNPFLSAADEDDEGSLTTSTTAVTDGNNDATAAATATATATPTAAMQEAVERGGRRRKSPGRRRGRNSGGIGSGTTFEDGKKRPMRVYVGSADVEDGRDGGVSETGGGSMWGLRWMRGNKSKDRQHQREEGGEGGAVSDAGRGQAGVEADEYVAGGDDLDDEEENEGGGEERVAGFDGNEAGESSGVRDAGGRWGETGQEGLSLAAARSAGVAGMSVDSPSDEGSMEQRLGQALLIKAGER